MKIIKKLSIVFFMFFLILIFNYKVQSAYLKEGIENFPESYKPYLEVLKERYPNWNFTALYTDLCEFLAINILSFLFVIAVIPASIPTSSSIY